MELSLILLLFLLILGFILYYFKFCSLYTSMEKAFDEIKNGFMIEYCKLFPLKILKLLHIRDIQQMQVKMHEQTEAAASILTVSVKSFSDLSREKEGRNMFAYVNKILSVLIPVASEYNGVIDCFTGAGFRALYLENPEDGLKCALEMNEKMKEYQSFAVGLCYGSAYIGMVGSEIRMQPMTISGYTGISEFLQMIAPKYGARVIMTWTCAKEISEFTDKYTYREIGYVKIQSTNGIVKIIDIFAGDEQEIYWLKKKTRLMFEEGVRLFAIGHYVPARKHFVEVLKIYGHDSAAKVYLYLCDTRIEEQNNKNRQENQCDVDCIEEY